MDCTKSSLSFMFPFPLAIVRTIKQYTYISNSRECVFIALDIFQIHILLYENRLIYKTENIVFEPLWPAPQTAIAPDAKHNNFFRG